MTSSFLGLPFFLYYVLIAKLYMRMTSSFLGLPFFLYYVLIAKLYMLITFIFSSLYFWADRSSRVRLTRSSFSAASWKDTMFLCLERKIKELHSIACIERGRTVGGPGHKCEICSREYAGDPPSLLF